MSTTNGSVYRAADRAFGRPVQLSSRHQPFRRGSLVLDSIFNDDTFQEKRRGNCTWQVLAERRWRN